MAKALEKVAEDVEKTFEQIWESQAKVLSILREVKHHLRNEAQIATIRAKRNER